ncbi:MAG: recombination protein RecR, partial [Pseudomonadota bacterium]
DPAIEEVILALPATMDGQTTAHVVQDYLEDAGVRITALGRGVPVGGELDYLDDGTLSAALAQRRAL